MRTSIQSASPERPLNGLSQPIETDRKSVAGALFTKALYRSGLSQKEAAYYMGVSEGQLSRQISGLEHLSLQRTMRLPVSFWIEFLAQLAEYHGIAVQVADRRQTALANAIGALATLQAVLGDRP